ncbi:DUF2749 domain-containing protein [Pleomorphomonas sp. T1.2MG-36]|uniref:DUF2749 domain-containing protein n=1 Tax=Pleomorphomonas sp. T1.2MG-36 TaxID=3041167 RepID=UPI00406D402F
MVNRTLFFTTMIASLLSASIAGAISWQVAGSRTCIEGNAPAQPTASTDRRQSDFFKSTAPPLTGGQEMRPRW